MPRLPQSIEVHMEGDFLNSLDDDIRFVRVLWTDNANVIRGKAIHRRALANYAEHGVGITAASQAMPAMYDAVIPETGLGPIGEIRLVPDFATFTPLPYSPGHARVMGDLLLDGEPWPLCPRGFLKRIADDVASEGLEVMAGFENEFFLMKPTPDGRIAPADETVFAATLSMDLACTVIDNIVEALLDQSIPVELYYPESGPGQHELSATYTTLTQAADWQVVFRETVHAVAARHDLKASFLPKVYPDKAGCGCHLHLSLWKDGKNIFPDASGPGGLSDTALSFLAGVLEHLPALAAIVAPSPNSYRRLQPHYWSGAYRCWGLDNREAAVRVPSSPTGDGSTHFELKTVDATSNPYLAAGCVVAAGLDGIRRKLKPAPPVQVDPGSLSDAERAERNIDALPANLGDAIKQLAANKVLTDALGPGLAKSFLAVRQAEWDAMKDFQLEDEVSLLLERY
ncbi:glutamine synthetase family protein [Bremerella sp. P1]|uniref:glutamine synthetase family protein n=1 Tax=Bremerella sp. P1 TaxID=3026424 RepID=UPI002367E5A5|nr:glutamine synthetase family protein [Bremerella sp. P1]WDI42188.1 glutamine synthetase family protein [Bremerella sp. P1]